MHITRHGHSLRQDLVEQGLSLTLLFQVGLGPLFYQLLQVVGILLHARQQVVQDVAAVLSEGQGAAGRGERGAASPTPSARPGPLSHPGLMSAHLPTAVGTLEGVQVEGHSRMVQQWQRVGGEFSSSLRCQG